MRPQTSGGGTSAAAASSDQVCAAAAASSYQVGAAAAASSDQVGAARQEPAFVCDACGGVRFAPAPPAPAAARSSTRRKATPSAAATATRTGRCVALIALLDHSPGKYALLTIEGLKVLRFVMREVYLGFLVFFVCLFLINLIIWGSDYQLME